jgi:RNA polymerase sigma-70 factor, ECF subfamily
VIPRAESDDTSDLQLHLPLEGTRADQAEVAHPASDIGLREWITGLWLRHQSVLLELAHYHLRDWDRAQDVVQDTWVDFLKGLHRFEGRCSPKTWLVQILIRRIRKERRTMIIRRAWEALRTAKPSQSYDDAVRRHVTGSGGWDPNPEHAILVQESLEYILRVSRTLPGRQADVWILRDLFQWTSEEASTALAISPQNQRVLLHRARQRLRLELERHFGQDASACGVPR